MKKTHSLILVGAAMLVASCATTLKRAPTSNIDISDNESNPITKLNVTIDFNGGTYNGESTITFNDVMPTTYFRYVKERLTETITPPEHCGTLKGYSFSIDDKDNLIPNDYVIREDITVYAQYEISDPYCTVEWLDEDGSTLATENCFLNDTPEFKGTLPYYEGKIFGHWNPTIHPVTQEEIEAGSISYTAVYVTVYHEVVLDYNDGSASEEHTQKVLDGECLVKPDITRSGYTLKEWRYVNGGTGVFKFNVPITKDDIKIEAIWTQKKYTVTWLDYDGSIIDKKEVNDGEAPTKPSDPIRQSSPFVEYTFVDWLPEISKEVHSDQTYVAMYKTHFYSYTEAYMHINIVEGNTAFSFTFAATSNITIDWGDGNTQKDISAGTISHTYTTVGEYNVRILNPLTAISAKNSTLIEELYLGRDITSIGSSAFYGCSNLKTVTFGKESQLTSISMSAFHNCSNLKTVTFEEGSQLKSIGGTAFTYCSSLIKIAIPSGVTTIGGSAFDECRNLQTVTFEEGSQLKSIDQNAFRYCSFTSITIPSGVTTINNYAFRYCSNLQTVTFEEGSQLKLIDDGAFANCPSLIKIAIPSEVTTIGESAFNLCKGLQTVTFEEGSQLKSIGESAFLGCGELKVVDLTILDTPPTLGSDAFRACDLNLKIYVKADKVETFKAAPGWSTYANNIVPGPVPSIN